MQSQYKDLLECGGCCAGYSVFNMCWMGACKILDVEQQAVEGMGKGWQSKIYTDNGVCQRVEAGSIQEYT